MSQWTHVAGVIRFDALRVVLPDDFDPRSWLGEVRTFDQPDVQTDIPCGSEGSLQYSVGESAQQSSRVLYGLDLRGPARLRRRR